MDYEKKYKEALERARQFSEKPYLEDSAGIVEYIFPELKESEDERIRKALIRAFKSLNTIKVWSGIERTDIIAWLEKQGTSVINWNNNTEENKPPLSHSVLMKTTQGIAEGEWKGDRWIIYRWSSNIKNSDVLSWIEFSDLEKQQKPADKVEPVEPKFHEGDWVVLTAGELSTTLQIVSVDINKKLYWFNDSSYLPIVDEQCLHHWTIQDAKDGDVLAAHECIVLFKEIDGLNIKCHCTYHFMNNPSFYVNTLQNKSAFHPATKEQREQLEKAMAEAGYEWDTEKKELKKIEQSKLTEFEDAVKDMMDAYRDAIGDCDATTEEVKKHAAYMLSLIPLKPTVEWKPSEEQMDALESAVSSLQSSTLETLYQDLKREKNYE